MGEKRQLINGLTGNVICIFQSEKIATDWLKKQIREFPNGHYIETRSYIDYVPGEEPQLEEGQIDLFEYLKVV